MPGKLYIAKAMAYCPFVKLPGFENKQPIQFHFGRHSTGDEVEQKALESHASFGKSFYLVKGKGPPLPPEATATTVGAVTTAGRPVGIRPKPAPPIEPEPNPKAQDQGKPEPGEVPAPEVKADGKGKK